MGALRLSRRWVVAGAAAAAAVLVVLAVVLRAGDERRRAQPIQIEAHTRITPDAHLFGDRIRAELDVVLDASRVDPDSVRVLTEFPPYRILGGGPQSRTSANGIVRIRFAYSLLCLALDCLPGEGAKRFGFNPAEVRYRGPQGTIQTLRAEWPSVSIMTRLPPPDERNRFFFEWRPIEVELPPVEGKRWYRVVDTWLPEGEDIVSDEEAAFLAEDVYEVRPRSTIVLIAR